MRSFYRGQKSGKTLIFTCFDRGYSPFFSRLLFYLTQQQWYRPYFAPQKMTGCCGSPGAQQGRYRPWNSLGDTGLDRGRFPQGPRARPRYRRLSRKSLQGLGVLYANTNGRGAITLTLLAHIRDPGRPDEKEKKRKKNHQTKRNARSGREGVVHEWNRERSLTTDRLSGCRVRWPPAQRFVSLGSGMVRDRPTTTYSTTVVWDGNRNLENAIHRAETRGTWDPGNRTAETSPSCVLFGYSSLKPSM